MITTRGDTRMLAAREQPMAIDPKLGRSSAEASALIGAINDAFRAGNRRFDECASRGPGRTPEAYAAIIDSATSFTSARMACIALVRTSKGDPTLIEAALITAVRAADMELIATVVEKAKRPGTSAQKTDPQKEKQIADKIYYEIARLALAFLPH